MSAAEKNCEESELDPSLMEYEEWIEFVFEQAPFVTAPIVLFAEPVRAVAHMNRLFHGFAEIGQRYTLEEIDQGIYFLLGSWCWYTENLFDTRVPLADRLTAIRAMYHVYADFVALSPAPVMVNCFDMWWDMLAGTYQLNTRWEDGVPGEEARVTGDAMLETLVRILHLPDLRTQGYALHGLGHLNHPRRAAVVQAYIDTNRSDLPPEALVWVEECRDGTVM